MVVDGPGVVVGHPRGGGWWSFAMYSNGDEAVRMRLYAGSFEDERGFG